MIFYTSFAVLFPLFGKIALGYALRHFDIVSEKTLYEINSVIFKILLPVLVFINIYHTDVVAIDSYRVLWFSAVSVIVSFIIFMVIVPIFVKENSRRGVLVQAITRSNFIFFGMPMVISLCGNESIGLVTLLIAIVSPIFNIISVISL